MLLSYFVLHSTIICCHGIVGQIPISGTRALVGYYCVCFVWIEMSDSIDLMIKLIENNWQIWKLKMEDILYCKDLYDPIEGDEAKPADMSDKDWNKQNKKTVGTIRQ